MRILRCMGYPINNCSTLERMMLAQAQALRQQGHEMQIVFDGVRRPAARQEAQALAPDIKLHFDLPPCHGWHKPLAALAYLRAMARLIRAEKIDIVHLYFDPSARLLNQLARFFPQVRFLRTIGSTPLVNFGNRHLDALKRRKWVLELAQMQRVVCVGGHIGELLVRYGVPPQRIAVVPNAIDVDRFQRWQAAAPQKGGALRLGFIGRLTAVKNIELMLDGMARLKQAGLTDVLLRIVGDGELRESLQNQVQLLGVQQQVEFLGQVGDIPRLLNTEIDLYVQASHNEGCPAAVIEAMACEVPVLLSDIPGHRQVAQPERHGSYFAAGDAAGFAAAVQRIQADYSTYVRMAQQARQHIVDNFSTASWIAQELAVYRSLMAG